MNVLASRALRGLGSAATIATRYINVGSFTHADPAGANRFRFSGCVHGRRLRPGTYRMRAIPRNAAGAGRAVYRKFGVKR